MCFLKNFKEVLKTLTLQNADRLLLLKYLLKIKSAALDHWINFQKQPFGDIFQNR